MKARNYALAFTCAALIGGTLVFLFYRAAKRASAQPSRYGSE